MDILSQLADQICLGQQDRVRELVHEAIAQDMPATRILSQGLIPGMDSGDGDFVMEILSQSEETFSRKYRLKSRGLDFERVVQKVASLLDVEADCIMAKGRERDRVAARDLVCYGCAAELEIPMADLARKLNMTVAGVSYAVKRGEKVAKQRGWSLEDRLT